MSAAEGMDLFEFGFEQENDEKIFLRWVNGAQYTIGFDEFKRQLVPTAARFKKDEEVLDDVRSILESLR